MLRFHTNVLKIQAKIGSILFKLLTINSPYLSQYGHKIPNSTDHLGSTWNISQNKIVPYATCMKKCIHIYRENFTIFFFKKTPSITKHTPPFNFYFYYMEFYRVFLIQYNLIGIVKPKFTRRICKYDAEF